MNLFNRIKLPPSLASKGEALREAWAQADKRTIKIFAFFAVGVWFIFVAVFFALAKWNETDGPVKQTQSETSGPSQLRAGNTGNGGDFEPQFVQQQGLTEEDNLKAHKELMEIYYQRGMVAKSFEHSQKISSYFKSDTSFLLKSAQIHFDLGNYDKALREAKNLLAINPGMRAAQALEFHALFRLGKVSESEKLAEKYLKSAPNDVKLLTTAGTMAIEARKGKRGNDTYLKKALAINPGYVPALYQMGRKHRLEGNYADARHYFKKCIALDPINAKARAQLGAVYFYLHQDKLALKEYQTALYLNKKDFNTWYNIGELYLSMANNTSTIQKRRDFRLKALESYQQALWHNPILYSANFRMGVLLNGNRQHKEAIRYFKKVLSAQPYHLRALIQISAAYEHLKMEKDALKYLEMGFKLAPNNKTILHKLRLLSASS